MLPYQGLRQQAIAVSSASRKSAHFACLFTQGGSHAKKGEFAGMGCFEGVAFLVMVQFRHHLATNECPKDAASRRPSPTGIKQSGKATFA